MIVLRAVIITKPRKGVFASLIFTVNIVDIYSKFSYKPAVVYTEDVR